jgi:hypothetical protein
MWGGFISLLLSFSRNYPQSLRWMKLWIRFRTKRPPSRKINNKKQTHNQITNISRENKEEEKNGRPCAGVYRRELSIDNSRRHPERATQPPKNWIRKEKAIVLPEYKIINLFLTYHIVSVVCCTRLNFFFFFNHLLLSCLKFPPKIDFLLLLVCVLD